MPCPDPSTSAVTYGLSLHSWEYFQLLSPGSTTLEQLSSGAEIALPFLSRSLGLDATVERLMHDLRKMSPVLLRRHILMHYLLSSWPVHFLVFLERLQRLLQEEYHYSSESPTVLKWNKSMLQGKYWCVSEHHEGVVPHLQSFFNTLVTCFARLPLAGQKKRKDPLKRFSSSQPNRRGYRLTNTLPHMHGRASPQY